MKLHHHTTSSTLIAGMLYLIFKSWELAVSCFVSGIFIDLDHFIDVIREYGWSFRIKDFFRICYTAQFERVMLICHGWEWLVLWAAAAWLTDWNPWVTGAFIGLTQHVILDVYQNSWDIRSYSLLWRWKNNFHFDTTFPRMTYLKYDKCSSHETKK